MTQGKAKVQADPEAERTNFDLEPQAQAGELARIQFEFEGDTYTTRVKPSVKTIRALTQKEKDYDMALVSLIGQDGADLFYERHDDEDGEDCLQRFFTALGKHIGGNSLASRRS